jgi:hypothetical protein
MRPRELTGVVEASWLFTRGRESVRLVRVALEHGGVRLMIDGPGDMQDDLDFVDVIYCMAHQSEIERRLVAEGFHLESFGARLDALDARPGSRRRCRSATFDASLNVE